MTDKEILLEMFKAIERLDENVGSINVTLGKQEVHLEEHIRRTELLEKNLEGFDERMKPIQKHVDRINTLILLLGGIFALLGAIKTIIEIIKVL